MGPNPTGPLSKLRSSYYIDTQGLRGPSTVGPVGDFLDSQGFRALMLVTKKSRIRIYTHRMRLDVRIITIYKTVPFGGIFCLRLLGPTKKGSLFDIHGLRKTAFSGRLPSLKTNIAPEDQWSEVGSCKFLLRPGPFSGAFALTFGRDVIFLCFLGFSDVSSEKLAVKNFGSL